MEKAPDNIKIVLLPGLDGTGELFYPLLQRLSVFDVKIIKLPLTGNQDYETLSNHLKLLLPTKDFILVAESFSGPIAAILANKNISALKGIVFVATFLSTPAKHLLALSQYVPVKALLNLPLSDFFTKHLLFESTVTKEMLEKFNRVVKTLPATIFKQRLKVLLNLKFNYETCDIPSVYLQPENDRLVDKDKYEEFERYFSNISRQSIAGPHFLLQTQPDKCAEEIQRFYRELRLE